MEINITSSAPNAYSMEVVGADEQELYKLLVTIGPVIKNYLTAIEALGDPDRNDLVGIAALKLQCQAQMSILEQSAQNLHSVYLGDKTIGECGYPEFGRDEDPAEWE